MSLKTQIIACCEFLFTGPLLIEVFWDCGTIRLDPLGCPSYIVIDSVHHGGRANQKERNNQHCTASSLCHLRRLSRTESDSTTARSDSTVKADDTDTRWWRHRQGSQCCGWSETPENYKSSSSEFGVALCPLNAFTLPFRTNLNF